MGLPFFFDMPSFILNHIISPALVLLITFVQAHMGGVLLAQDADCLLIMGSKVLRDGRPDLMMRERISKALELDLEKYRVIITTGGTIDSDVPAESAVLYRLLVEGGVSEEKIVEETQSTSTYENLNNSLPILEEQSCKRVDILSHDFHLPRILLVSERLDIPVNKLIAAKVEGRSVERLLRREYAAFAIYWLAWDWVFEGTP